MINPCNNLFENCFHLTRKTGLNSFAIEFVRWRRKPRWLPVAKSKEFRIPHHEPQSREERDELLRLHNNYRTKFRCIRHYLIEENKRVAETSSAGHFVLTPEEEEKQLQACLELNAKWNEEVKVIREKRISMEREKNKIYVEERKRKIKEKEEETMEKIEEFIRTEKEASKHFITREKLQEAIEHALANPIDYNFAVDLQGNIYRGRNNGGPTTTAAAADKQQAIKALQSIN